MGPWMTSDNLRVTLLTDRRESIRLTPLEPCPHYRCPSCPWEGDEMGMINHALAYGHQARVVEECSCA